MGLSNLKSVEMKGFRVRVPVADYDVLEYIAETTGFDVGFLIRYMVHDEVVDFLENHPELQDKFDLKVKYERGYKDGKD